MTDYKTLLILQELVDALNDTYWSSWQSTAKFSPALQAAENHLGVYLDKEDGLL